MPDNLQEILMKDFGVKSLEELKIVWDREMGFLASERDKTKRLEQDLIDQKEITKTQTQALQTAEEEAKDYVDKLVEKLNPDPREYQGVEKSKIVVLEIDRLLNNEADKIKQISDLEKQIDKVKADKQEEIDKLKKEIVELRDANAKQNQQIERLSKRLDELESDNLPLPPIKDGNSIADRLGRWLKWLKDLLVQDYE